MNAQRLGVIEVGDGGLVADDDGVAAPLCVAGGRGEADGQKRERGHQDELSKICGC